MISLRTALLLALACLAAACGGDSTSPTAVASVVIISSTASISFQTLGRTAAVSAQARNGHGAVLADTITWTSSNPAVAVMSSPTGMTSGVTATGNGTALISASAGGQTSTAVAVTVSQVAVGIGGVPAAVAFGAIGSTKQLTAAAVDSGGAPVGSAATPVFSRGGSGASATVSAAGLVTAVGNGTGDTVVVTAGGLVVRAPIAVTQVANSLAVISTSATPDTLFTATRTRQFTAIVGDSNGNAIPGVAVAWSSSLPGVATVNAASGLVTAGTADGTTIIRIALGSLGASRPLAVRRYVASHSVTPSSAAISTPGGTQAFTGSLKDSANVDIPIHWVAENFGFLNLTSPIGNPTSATATALRNSYGPTYVLLTAPGTGLYVDSAEVTVTGQPSFAPAVINVTVGDVFFQSARNGSRNPAVDTIDFGGTITWTWTGSSAHGIVPVSGGTFDDFLGTPAMTAGTFAFRFTEFSTFDYYCTLHGALMSGRIVVR